MKFTTPIQLGCVLLLTHVIDFKSNAVSWDYTGSLSTGRYYTTANVLSNGKVLVAGGSNGSSLASAELYNPATGLWSATGSLGTARQRHTATLLNNGKVLVVGGRTTAGTALSSAELYDPATGTWSATGSLSNAREEHKAILLSDGKVLVTGGYKLSPSTTYSSCEIFNPATGTWSSTGSMNAVRYRHDAVLLPDGKVLAAGGFSTSGTVSSAERFNPSTGTWTTTGSMTGVRADFKMALLPNGKVLVAGGNSFAGGVDVSLATAELYTPSSGTWATTGSLGTARRHLGLNLLSNGKVLATAGYGSGFLSSCELYNPTSGTWGTTAALNAARAWHRAVILSDGTPLVVAGAASGTVAPAEIYDGGCIAVLQWSFTDVGFIAGGQGGAPRAYSNPSSVSASPWSFQSLDKDSLRMSFEDDANCGHYNPYTQTGTASVDIVISCDTRMFVDWSGVGEQQLAGFELMSLFLDGSLIGEAHAPGGQLGCAPMAPVVSNPAPPQYIDLSPGTYTLDIETTTNDQYYHRGAYYQFNLSFESL